MSAYFLLKFITFGLIFGASFFYLIWCAVARKFIRPDWYILSLYMTSGFFVAVITEPFHAIIYRHFFGEYLWVYQVLPIFDGASSLLAPLCWPFYGYYMYFFHVALETHGIRISTFVQGLFPGIDGVFFDIIANIFFLITTGVIFFYYPRTELWHLSSFWVMPFYAVSGIIYAYTLRHFLGWKKNWKIPTTLYALGVAVVIIGELFF